MRRILNWILIFTHAFFAGIALPYALLASSFFEGLVWATIGVTNYVLFLSALRQLERSHPKPPADPGKEDWHNIHIF